MPNTLLARTFVLLASLVILTTAAWLVLFRHLDTEPRARETAQLAASTVNLIRAAIFAAAPENRPALFNELSRREGIRLLPAENDERIRKLPDSRYFQLVQQELASRLGIRTKIAAAVDGIEGFWVSFRLVEEDEDEYWLILPAERVAHDIASQWLLWAPLAFILALAVAALIASRISRPLKLMARSAALVGRGERPEPLPVTGPEELGELASSFNRMADDLRQLENDRAEVLAGISHDLRTPLTRLRLEAEMSIVDDAAREAAVADIEQMDSILSQFMDYARGDQTEPPETTDLTALVRSIADSKMARGMALTARIEALPPLLCRPRALQRALNNLIDNACKYGAGHVELSLGMGSRGIELAVEDDGPGVPADQVERLKRPFARLEDARSNASGTGLGLAIVDRVARLHGADFVLENRPEGGLRAVLRFKS